MLIHTSFYASPIGILQIDADEVSIIAVTFINSWKGAKINEADITIKRSGHPLIEQCKSQLEQYFNGSLRQFDLPFTQPGTDFQQTVWHQLTLIPYGKTISYLQLARQISNVKAIRAVGTANGNNKISIIIPCHRVIGANGDLIGYGGDLWRKKWLLEHENKWQNGVQKLF